MASLAPTQLISNTFVEYAGYWLKFYTQGTTTPITMDIDATSGTSIAKAEISSGGTVPIGFIKTAGNVVFIPYVDEAYDAWLFPTEAEADANDTSSAVQIANNVFLETYINLVIAGSSASRKHFATGTAMIADADINAGDYVVTSGRVAAGDGGDSYYLAQAVAGGTQDNGSILASTGKPAIELVNLFPGGIVRVMHWGLDKTGVVDGSTKFQELLTYVTGKDAIIDTGDGTYLINAPVIITSPNQYKFTGQCTFQIGTSFAAGGGNADTLSFTFKGNAPTAITPAKLFYNYWTDTSVPTVKKGDRILISDNDSANYWDVGGNNYRNSISTFVDFSDSTNNVVNFYPQIDFPVTYANASTNEINPSNILINVYQGDIDLIIEKGITFQGALNTLATHTARAYGKGMLLKRGRFHLECSFVELNDAIRVEEGELTYRGNMYGGYSTAGGNGIKPVQGSLLLVSDSIIVGYRHAIAVAGSTQDGASAYITNSRLGDARQANNATLYPQNESVGLDAHGNAKHVYVNNCEITGIQTGGYYMHVSNSTISSQTSNPLSIRQQEPVDGGEFNIINCNIKLAPFFPSNADALGGGIGTFETTIYIMKDGAFASTAVDWKVLFDGCTIGTQDGTDFAASTVVHIEPGDVELTRLDVRNCTFEFSGTNIREVAIDPRTQSTDINLINNKFLGCGLTVGVRGPDSQDWKSINIHGGVVENTNTTAGQSFTHAIQVSGDTTSGSVNRRVSITDVNIESIGDSSFITLDASCSEGLVIKDNEANYTNTGGTLVDGIRTNRNQNVVTSDHFIAHVDNNTLNIDAADTGNHITTGINILGLAAGGGGLGAGFYRTGNNAVKGAATPISTTGTALAGV